MIKEWKDFILKLLYLLIIIYLLVFIPIIWGKKPLVVKSGSMEPTLEVGSLFYYKEVKIDDLKENDIVVYKMNNDIVSHRIVEIHDGEIITKGDKNDVIDGIIDNSKIIGKGNNWCIPLLGFYTSYIYNHKIILYLSILILIIDLIVDKYKERRKGGKV